MYPNLDTTQKFLKKYLLFYLKENRGWFEWWDIFLHSSLFNATFFNSLHDSFPVFNLICFVYDCLNLPLYRFPSCFSSIIVVIHVLLFDETSYLILFPIDDCRPQWSFFHLFSDTLLRWSLVLIESFSITLRHHRVSKVSIFLRSGFIIIHDPAPNNATLRTSVFDNVFLMFIVIAFVVRSLFFL